MVNFVQPSSDIELYPEVGVVHSITNAPVENRVQLNYMPIV